MSEENINQMRYWLLSISIVENTFDLPNVLLKMADWSIDDFCREVKEFHKLDSIECVYIPMADKYHIEWIKNE